MRKYAVSLLLLCALAAPALSAGDGAAERQAASAGNDGAAGSETRHSGWVSLESGARPVFVGIQGGTAPVSLLRSPEGGLFALTGKTGNDFTRILREDASSNATALTPDVAAADVVNVDEDFQPFGLSNPEGVTAAMAPEPVRAVDFTPLPVHSPLRLRSYKTVLDYTGSL